MYLFRKNIDCKSGNTVIHAFYFSILFVCERNFDLKTIVSMENFIDAFLYIILNQ